MRALWILWLCGSAHAQIEDEPSPAATAQPAAATAQPAPAGTAMAPQLSGVDVVVRFDDGSEVVGRLVSGDAETVTLETRFRRLMTVPRGAVRDLRLAVIPTAHSERQRLGARRFKHAGTGLMLTGGLCLLLVPLLWAAAVPLADRARNEYPYSSASSVILGAGAADTAFGILGAQLLTMGGIFYATGKSEEARLSAGLSVSY